MSRHLLIAGGGVAALESALAARAYAPDHVRVTLLAPSRHLVLRRIQGGALLTTRVPLADAGNRHAFTVVRDVLDRVDPDARRIDTQDGATLAYDALVLALGARPEAAIPAAFTFRGPRDLPRLRAAFDRLRDQGVVAPRIVLAKPDESSAGIDVYELALLADDWLAAAGLHAAEKIIVTPGPPPGSPEPALGLAHRGIVVRAGRAPGFVEDGRLWLPGEGALEADLVVALPVVAGPRVPGLPADESGFVPLADGNRVAGVEDVYVVGGMTGAGRSTPTLAQTEAVARALAVWAGAPVPEPAPLKTRLEPLLAGR